MPALHERAVTIRDALDAGVPSADVRPDIDALIADLELTAVGSHTVTSAPEYGEEVCSVCHKTIYRVSGRLRDFYRHAAELPYCPDKRPTPAVVGA